jgi:hypothetical protein
VLAACSGTVTYAGPVPARSGAGVSIRCGRLVATQLGLGAAFVRRGQSVPAGGLIGRLGAGGVLRLGARRAGDRLGYLDPRPLLAGPPPTWPHVAPIGRARRAAPPPAPASMPRAAPAMAAHPPVALWAGLALLGLGLGLGGAGAHAQRAARRRVRARAAVAGR